MKFKIMKKTGKFETVTIDGQEVKKEILEEVKCYEEDLTDKKQIDNLAYRVNLVKQSLEQDTSTEHIIEVTE